jgi:uncharacterized membrane protein
VVEAGHDLGLVDVSGTLVLTALLASFTLCGFAVDPLSVQSPFTRAFSPAAHFAVPVVDC